MGAALLRASHRGNRYREALRVVRARDHRGGRGMTQAVIVGAVIGMLGALAFGFWRAWRDEGRLYEATLKTLRTTTEQNVCLTADVQRLTGQRDQAVTALEA